MAPTGKGVDKEGRVKDRNIRANPKVGLSIPDPENPYRCLSIQGEVVEIREQGAIYYIGTFEFSDEEIRFFNVQILPEGAERSYQLKFQHKVYVE